MDPDPGQGFISGIIPVLGRQGAYANGGPEDLSCGFNVTLAVLRDALKRKMITDRLLVFAENKDKIVRMMKENI